MWSHSPDEFAQPPLKIIRPFLRKQTLAMSGCLKRRNNGVAFGNP